MEIVGIAITPVPIAISDKQNKLWSIARLFPRASPERNGREGTIGRLTAGLWLCHFGRRAVGQRVAAWGGLAGRRRASQSRPMSPTWAKRRVVRAGGADLLTSFPTPLTRARLRAYARVFAWVWVKRERSSKKR
jgi:hypothetical protein